MLIGESKPVSYHAGDKLMEGNISGNWSMVVRTTAVPKDAVLSLIVSLANDAYLT